MIVARGASSNRSLLIQHHRARLLHSSLGRQQRQQQAPSSLRYPIAVAPLVASRISGVRSPSADCSSLKRPHLIWRASPPRIVGRHASTDIHASDQAPPPPLPQASNSSDDRSPDRVPAHEPSLIKYCCYMATRLQNARSHTDDPFRIGQELDGEFSMADISGKGIRSEVSIVHSYLSDLLTLAGEISFKRSPLELEGAVPIGRQLAIAALTLKRHAHSTQTPIEGTVKAGEEILRFVRMHKKDVASRALIGIGWALKGNLVTALGKLEGAMNCARETVVEGLQRVEGLDVRNYRYSQPLGMLLQAIAECELDIAIARLSPASQTLQTRRHVWLRTQMKELRMTVETNRAVRETLIASRRILTLLGNLLSSSLILPFASRDNPETQRAFDDLLSSMTRTQVHNLIDTAIEGKVSKTKKKKLAIPKKPEGIISTQALLALGFGLVRLNRLDEALHVYVRADQAGLKLPERFARKLIRILSDAERVASLRQLMKIFQRQSVDDVTGQAHLEEQSYLVLGLFHAQRGELQKLRQLWKRFIEQHPHRIGSWAFKFHLLKAYSQRDNFGVFATHLHENWILPGSIEKSPHKRPLDDLTYMTAVNGYLHFNRLEEAEQLIRFLGPGYHPDVWLPAHNALLARLATDVDVAKAGELWSSMVQNGPEPTRPTYEVMIQLFARRGDLRTAFDFLGLMQDAGFVPSQDTLVTLLSKLVRAGEYSHADELFRSMLKSTVVEVDTKIWNCMLESLVRRNCPLRRVLKAYTEMRSEGYLPDARTYTLLIMSACEDDDIATAERFFAEADSAGAKLGDGAIGLPPTAIEGDVAAAHSEETDAHRKFRVAPNGRTHVPHFSLLISTHLRLKNFAAAKEYFNELRVRNIDIPAMTWSILVKAYLDSGSEANTRLARDIILHKLDEGDPGNEGPSSGDSETIEDKADHYEVSHRHRDALILYAPLLNSAAKRGDVDGAEAILTEIERTGSHLNISTLNILLNCYRRSFDLPMMTQIWNRLFDRVTAHLRVAGDFAAPNVDPKTTIRRGKAAFDVHLKKMQLSPVRRNALCLPLSIMLDAFSKQNRHQEIADIWSQVRSAGFAFDPYNWNQLATALASADRVEDAIRILDNVLNQLTAADEIRRLKVEARAGLSTKGIRRSDVRLYDADAYAEGASLHLAQRELLDEQSRKRSESDEQVMSPSRVHARLAQRRIAGKKFFSGGEMVYPGPGRGGILPVYLPKESQLSNQAFAAVRNDMDDKDTPVIHKEKRKIFTLLRQQTRLDQRRPFWRAHFTTMLAIKRALARYDQKAEADQLAASKLWRERMLSEAHSDIGHGDEGVFTPSVLTAEMLLKRYPRASKLLELHRFTWNLPRSRIFRLKFGP